MKTAPACPTCGSNNGLRLCLRCRHAHLFFTLHAPEFCRDLWHDEEAVVLTAKKHMHYLKMEIPTGWRLVREGPARGGDKYWNAREGAWYPLTVNAFTNAEAYVAVIRKGEE